MAGFDHGDLVCPSCLGPLGPVGTAIGCSGCGNQYAVMDDVPLLLAGLTTGPGREPTPEFLDDLSQAALPWAAAAARAPMQALFSTRFAFPDPRLGVEGHRFLHRLRSSGFVIREPYQDACDAAPAVGPAPSTAAPDGISLTVLTAPAAVRAGQAFWVQVRVTNNGRLPLPASEADAPTLSYAVEGSFRWRTLRREFVPAAAASRLLVDLGPGQTITQPVVIAGLDRTGPARLRIVVRWAGVATAPASPGPVIAMEVIGAAEPDPLEVDWPYSETIRDYGEDHAHAVRLLRGWVDERFGERPVRRVLELGGNAAPMLAAAGFGLPEARCFNVDIDPFGLVFGTVQRRVGGGRAIQDIVADGMRLPFAAGSLDLVVLFATLHHFPDPAAVLRHLATKLAAGGLICVCCEPIGHVSHDTVSPEFREELVAGICEQAFQPWEWRQLFQQAGLRIVRVQHDRGSLKAALEPDPAA